MFDEGTIDELKASLRGSLLLLADAGYGEALSLFNGMVDRRPAMSARFTESARGQAIRSTGKSQ